MVPHFWSPESICLHLRSAAGEQVCSLRQPFAVLGAHPDCDVVLEGQGIERRSLLIVLAADQIFGAVLHSTAKKAGRVFAISEQRALKLGRYALDVKRQGEAQHTPRDDAADSLAVITWKTRGVRYHAELPNHRPVLLGRRQPAAVVVDDESLSALHACLYRDGDELWVLDLCSANGTLVDRQLVRAARVKAGGSFRAGTSRFDFLQLHAAEAFQSLTARWELAKDSFVAERQNWNQHRKELLKALASLSEQQESQRERQLQEAELLVARIRELETQTEQVAHVAQVLANWQETMQTLCQQQAEQLTAERALREETEALCQQQAEQLAAECALREETEMRYAQQREDVAERARILDEAEREATQRELALLAQSTELRKQRAAFERDRQAALPVTKAHEVSPPAVLCELRPAGDDTCISSPEFSQILTAAIASHRNQKSV